MSSTLERKDEIVQVYKHKRRNSFVMVGTTEVLPPKTEAEKVFASKLHPRLYVLGKGFVRYFDFADQENYQSELSHYELQGDYRYPEGLAKVNSSSRQLQLKAANVSNI